MSPSWEWTQCLSLYGSQHVDSSCLRRQALVFSARRRSFIHVLVKDLPKASVTGLGQFIRAIIPLTQQHLLVHGSLTSRACRRKVLFSALAHSMHSRHSPTSWPVAASMSRKRSSRERTSRAAFALLMEIRKGLTNFSRPPSSKKKLQKEISMNCAQGAFSHLGACERQWGTFYLQPVRFWPGGSPTPGCSVLWPWQLPHRSLEHLSSLGQLGNKTKPTQLGSTLHWNCRQVWKTQVIYSTQSFFIFCVYTVSIWPALNSHKWKHSIWICVIPKASTW